MREADDAAALEVRKKRLEDHNDRQQGSQRLLRQLRHCGQQADRHQRAWPDQMAVRIVLLEWLEVVECDGGCIGRRSGSGREDVEQAERRAMQVQASAASADAHGDRTRDCHRE